MITCLKIITITPDQYNIVVNPEIVTLITSVIETEKNQVRAVSYIFSATCMFDYNEKKKTSGRTRYVHCVAILILIMKNNNTGLVWIERLIMKYHIHKSRNVNPSVN